MWFRILPSPAQATPASPQPGSAPSCRSRLYAAHSPDCSTIRPSRIRNGSIPANAIRRPIAVMPRKGVRWVPVTVQRIATAPVSILTINSSIRDSVEIGERGGECADLGHVLRAGPRTPGGVAEIDEVGRVEVEHCLGVAPLPALNDPAPRERDQRRSSRPRLGYRSSSAGAVSAPSAVVLPRRGVRMRVWYIPVRKSRCFSIRSPNCIGIG